MRLDTTHDKPIFRQTLPGCMIIIIVALVVWGGCQLYNMFKEPVPGTDTDSVAINEVADSASERRVNRETVKNELAVKANERWPDNPVRQEAWIRKQLDDWAFMESLPADPVKAQVQKNWPSDYSLQRAHYEEQLKSKRDIEQI